MGIEKFFNSLIKNNVANLNESFATKFNNDSIEITDLYIDFNSIVYIVVGKVLFNFNGILYGILTNNKKKIELHNNYGINIIDNCEVFIDEVKNKINEIIIDETEKYLLKIIQTLSIPNKLRLLYVAVDGVPTRAKMIEQKNRRYMTYIITAMQKRIFENHEADLQKDPIRYKYELLKISWNKNFITPGTIFMDKLDYRLNALLFYNKLKELCPNLDIYYYSGSRVIGEGEKKIYDHLRKSNYTIGKYAIYSGDTDVVLLCLLLNCPLMDKQKRYITELKMIRYNQQKSSHDIIDIDKLKSNICEYTNNTDYIRDIVFLLTIFGNDFLPKIITYDAKYDFTKIIRLLIESNTRIIVDDKLNFTNFVGVLKYLVKYEKINVANNYIKNKYRNFQKKDDDEPLKKLKKMKLNDNLLIHNDNNNINNKYHVSKIRQIVDSIDPLTKVTEYDKELYAFENKLGKYVKLLNSKDIELGKVYIKNNILKVRSMKKNKMKYYKKYFNVKSNYTLNNKIIYDATENYFEGLIWLYYYYYFDVNNYIYEELWYYKYPNSPMLGHILKYIKKYQPKIESFKKYNIDRERDDIITSIMSPLELLLYVTPCANVKEVIPKQFLKYIDDELYMDLDIIVDAILNGKGKKYIICPNNSFLSKCHLKKIDLSIDYIEFIQKYENIPHSHNGSVVYYNK